MLSCLARRSASFERCQTIPSKNSLDLVLDEDVDVLCLTWEEAAVLVEAALVDAFVSLLEVVEEEEDEEEEDEEEDDDEEEEDSSVKLVELRLSNSSKGKINPAEYM